MAKLRGYGERFQLPATLIQEAYKLEVRTQYSFYLYSKVWFFSVMFFKHQKADSYFAAWECALGFVGFVYVFHESLNFVHTAGCVGWHVGDSESKICGAEFSFHQWEPIWGLTLWVCRASCYWTREDCTRCKAADKKQSSSTISPGKSQGMGFSSQPSSGQMSTARTLFNEFSLSIIEKLSDSIQEGLKFMQKIMQSF